MTRLPRIVLPKLHWLLLGVLLLTQFALLQHQSDVGAHQDGLCLICLHATPLDHGVGAAALATFTAVVVVTPPLASSPAAPVVAQWAYTARAPPRLLSA